MKLKLILVLFLHAAASWGQTVSITWPANNEAVNKIIAVTGTASDKDAAITSVNVSVDGGPYSAATQYSDWKIWAFTIYTAALPVGAHTVSAQVIDPLGHTAFSTVTIKVFHSTPACSHTLVGAGIYCEQGLTHVEVTKPDSSAITFPTGYAAGNVIVVGVSANNRHVPWVSGAISNTAGYKWTFWGNQSSAFTDDDLVQNALYYTVVPSTIKAPDTITVKNAGSMFMVQAALVYSGVGALDGPGTSSVGWTGPGMNNSTGDYPVTVGDLNVAFTFGAPTGPVGAWAESLEDPARPYMMWSHQIASSKTANASWTSNVEGFIDIGVAFKPTGKPAATGVSILGIMDSAANGPTGTVAAGEYVSIYGTGVGPAAGVGMQIDPGGVISNSLGGTQVAFDGVFAPMLYASDSQTNVLVPYEIAASKQVNMQVSTGAGSSGTTQLQGVAAQPNVFTALNSDGSINSPSNLAPPGSLISIFVSGAGVLDHSQPDGTIAASPAPAPVLPVQVGFRSVSPSVPEPVIDEQTVTPAYAGAVPGTVINLMQVEAKVPTGCTGACTLAVRVGSINSPSFPLYVVADQ